jgi:hypothetical protein
MRAATSTDNTLGGAQSHANPLAASLTVKATDSSFPRGRRVVAGSETNCHTPISEVTVREES